jgi:uncharacterized protein
LVTIVERIAACRDPTDDKFLELAVNGRADMIVTGDLDHHAHCLLPHASDAIA